jgi:hypothetical protein
MISAIVVGSIGIISIWWVAMGVILGAGIVALILWAFGVI